MFQSRFKSKYRIKNCVFIKIHENQFPNVSFLVKQILKIPKPHIEIECVFSLTGVLTILRCCKLQVDNLDQIIAMLKNQPHNPHLNCSRYNDLTYYLKVESSLAEDNYDLIQESNYFEQLEMDND